MRRPEFVFINGSPDCCATGRRFPPRSTSSEKTVPVWKKSSNETARIEETIVDRRKRTQPRPTGPGLADDVGRRSRAHESGQNHQFTRVSRRDIDYRSRV